jgi:hypothetical protein
MATDPIQNAMIKAERIATLIVKDQIGISAYKTGNLQRSVSVISQRSGDVVELLLNDPTSYGDFTDFGTRSYRASERGPFNANPGKGQGGIIPRFWSSLSDTDILRIEMIFEEELDKAMNEEIDL